MSLDKVFNIASSGMSAQSLRLNTIASNIANAETVSSSIDQTYRARNPVFATVFNEQQGLGGSLFADQQQAGQGETQAHVHILNVAVFWPTVVSKE
jgi:flagellar basal-body rod protein FlgC